MFRRNLKKAAAVIMSAAMIMSTGALINQTALQAYAQEEQDNATSLALAEEEPETEEAGTAEDAEEKEEKITYETLETTKTDAEAVSALDVSDVVENVMPSIVSITGRSIQEVESYFYGKQEIEVEGAGSGVIIAQNDTELLVMTNNHIVDQLNELTVCFTVDTDDPEDVDKLLAPAVVKGTSTKEDLAVIAIELKDIDSEILGKLKVATLGSSEKLKVGESAIVIGNALGEGITVTTGIISALEKTITTEAGDFSVLQTDAAVNLGCSGGAILNKKGEVVGIVDAKDVADYAESMGYGIPIDEAIPVLKDLINRETRTEVENHGFLGVTVVPVSDEAKAMYNMPAGAFVYEVSKDSSADKAGIKKGDIITAFDGIDIDSSDRLVSTISYYEAGETVTVEIQTADNGSYTAKEVEVTLQEGTDTEAKAEKDEEEEKDRDEKKKPDDSEDTPDLDGFDEYPDFGYGQDDGFNWDDFGNFFFGDGYGNSGRGYEQGNGNF